MLRYFEFGRGSARGADQRATLRALPCLLFAIVLLGGVFAELPFAQAATLKTGDIVITAAMSGQFSAADSALLRVDPLTGDRTIISDATHGVGPMFQVGSSSGTVVPSGISRVDDGRFLVAAQNGIFYVDPASGDRSQVSTTPATSAITIGSQIFAVDRSQLMRIDPATGTSLFLAPLSNGFSLIPWDGNLMVAGIERLAQYHLDGTLVENYLSGFWSTSMAAYGEGKLLLGGINSTWLRDFKSNSGMGIGRTTAPEVGIGVGADGTVWLAVTDGFGFAPYNAIVGFDPNDNNALLKILSDATHGSGPAFYAPAGLYVVPEPSSIVLALFGALALVGFTALCR